MGVQKNRKPTIAPDTSGDYQDVAGGGGSGAGELDRSTTEQSAGFTNLAGDTVYVKTVAITAGPNNSVVNIPHGISNLKKLVRLQAFFDDGTYFRSINNLEATITATCHWAMDATNLILVSGVGSGGDYSGYSGEAAIWYTKTA